MSPRNSEKKGIGRSALQEDVSGRKPAGKSWFFGVGINEYEHFSNLNNAVKDVKDVLLLLQDQYDLDPERVITLFDEEATRDHIIDRLDELVELVGPDDKLLIYYSGHGSLNKRTNLAYWIPQDAKRHRTSGYIPNSTIRDYIKAINSFHTLLISDSCFSGTLFVRGAARSDAAVEELAQRRSRWGIVSGRHDEEVYDGEPGTNSPFAASILKVLRRNRHDKLNVARLADQVVEMTRSNYTQLPEGNPLFGVGHDGGQYVFRLVGSEANIWERSLAENSLAAFNTYLDRFPNGSHAGDALQHIKDLEEQKEWQRAGRIDKIYAYRSFLRSFPNGNFAADANTRIRQLQEADKGNSEPANPSLPPPTKTGTSLWRKYLPHMAGGVLAILLIIWAVGQNAHQPSAIAEKTEQPVTDIEKVDNAISTPKVGSISFGEETYSTIQYLPDRLIWMTKNLNYEVPNSWCYYKDPVNCDRYGRLYTWSAAKAACAALGSGWRLPTDKEWKSLANAFGGYSDFEKSEDIGDPRKAYWALMEGGNSGFFAQLGGYRFSNGRFSDLGGGGVYWTATEGDSDKAWYYSFDRGSGKLDRDDWLNKSDGISCRCVQDAPTNGKD